MPMSRTERFVIGLIVGIVLGVIAMNVVFLLNPPQVRVVQHPAACVRIVS